MFGGVKRHKYGAKPVVACKACGLWHQKGPFEWRGACINCRHGEGIRFASQLEAKMWAAYRDMEKRGEISELELQPRFPLVVNGVKIGTYVGDFRFRQGADRVVVDAKGAMTPVFRIKMKLVEALHGIKISIVRNS